MHRSIALLAALALTTACDPGYGSSTGISTSIPPATKLVITGQPSNAAPNAQILPAVQVAVQNVNGTTITTSNVLITMSIDATTGTAGAVLSGTFQVPATNGVANFSNLRINLAGTGYKLTATASGLASATTATFNIQ